jgi:hypothetical protein
VASLAELLAAPWVADLEELDLDLNYISPDGAERLLGVQWRRLRRLDLRYQNGHGFEGFRMLKTRPEARHLELEVVLENQQ